LWDGIPNDEDEDSPSCTFECGDDVSQKIEAQLHGIQFSGQV
jgi:hypothetical protein